MFGCLQLKAQGMKAGVYRQVRAVSPHTHLGFIPVANAESLYEWNEIDAAVKSLMEGINEAEQVGNPGALVPAMFTLAKINLARGNLTAALEAAARERIRSGPRPAGVVALPGRPPGSPQSGRRRPGCGPDLAGA